MTYQKKLNLLIHGSAKDTKSMGGDEFFTVDEYMALTAEDLDNPKIYDKAMTSLAKFYEK